LSEIRAGVAELQDVVFDARDVWVPGCGGEPGEEEEGTNACVLRLVDADDLVEHLLRRWLACDLEGKTIGDVLDDNPLCLLVLLIKCVVARVCGRIYV
jgi:hypothetical protein